jgi:RNA polymerase sigma factor (sigma-70 family)
MFTHETWKKLIASLTAHLRRRVANPFDAEDLVQESLLILLAKSPTLENDEHLHFYLRKVGQHQVANYQRKKKRARRTTADPVFEATPVDPSQPDDAYQYQELLRAVKEIAASLSPREQTLLDLRMNGSSPEEICQSMGIDAKTRSVLEFRLRQRLRQSLVKKGYRFAVKKRAGPREPRL